MSELPSHHCMFAEPALSRFDRFLLIGPRAKRGPALRLEPTQTYIFYGNCLCKLCSADAEPSVFQVVLRDQNDYQIFPTVSQNTVQIRFTTTIKIHQNLDLQTSRYSDETVAVFEIVFAVSKIKT